MSPWRTSTLIPTTGSKLRWTDPPGGASYVKAALCSKTTGWPTLRRKENSVNTDRIVTYLLRILTLLTQHVAGNSEPELAYSVIFAPTNNELFDVMVIIPLGWTSYILITICNEKLTNIKIILKKVSIHYVTHKRHMLFFLNLFAELFNKISLHLTY